MWGGKIRGCFLKEVALGALFIHGLQTWDGKLYKVSELTELMVDGEDDRIDKFLLYVVIECYTCHGMSYKWQIIIKLAQQGCGMVA